MKFKGPERKFGARWLSHGGAVGLTEFIGLDAVFIEEQQVDGIVNHDDAHVVHITGLEQAQIHDDAHIRVDGDGWSKARCVLFKTGRGGSAAIGLNTQRRGQQEQHQGPCRSPTHGPTISTVHFNDWV